MLTPVGVTSSAYWDAIKAGNATHVRITFTGQNIVLDDSDIDITKGLEITDIFNGDTDLVFGKAIAKQIRVGIINSSKLNGLIWSGEFTLEMGVEIGNPLATNWVQIGVFSGKKPNNVTSVNVIDFVAYDRMTLFDVLADTFYNSLTYPKTVQQIYNELCSYVGLTNVSGDELPNIMSRSYAAAPVDMSGYTCREILAWIAEASGCYARMTADGQVKLSWFTDNTAHAVTGDEEFSVESGDINDGMTWDEEDQYTWDELDQMTNSDIDGYRSTYRVEQLTVKQLGSDFDIDYPSEFPGANLYMIVENPFLSVSTATEITNYIKPIYDRLDAFGGYLPISIDCVGCWLVEAGDIVTVDANTETIVIPVFVRTLRWNGAINDNYEATGNKERQQYATSQSKEKVLENKYIKLITKDLYYGIQSGIEIEPSGITISGGKYIDIKSGSMFKVESGGNIDIKGTGTLALRGSTVSIKSGSTFSVDSSNLVIDTTSGYFGVKKISSTYGNKELEVYIGAEPNNTGNKMVVAMQPLSQNVTIGGVVHTQYYFGYAIVDKISEEGYTNRILMNFGINYNTFKEVSQFRPTLYLASTRGASPPLTHNDCLFTTDLIQCDELQVYDSILTDEIKSQNVYYHNLTQYSSKDVKHNIKPLEHMGNKIDLLQPVTFIYDDDENEQTRMGLIYEDAIEVMPEICTQDEGNKAISYIELVPALLKEIQDLRKRVSELEERG